jgi:hypothetical protein
LSPEAKAHRHKVCPNGCGRVNIKGVTSGTRWVRYDMVKRRKINWRYFPREWICCPLCEAKLVEVFNDAEKQGLSD